MCARHEAGDVEEFYGYGASAGDAGTVVGFTFVADSYPGTGAVYLEVAYCSLGVDCCESCEGVLDMACW